jgi:hypothetical protein
MAEPTSPVSATGRRGAVPADDRLASATLRLVGAG